MTTLAFIIYLSLMLVIGFLTMKKTKKTDDYFLGAETSGHGSPLFPPKRQICPVGCSWACRESRISPV